MDIKTEGDTEKKTCILVDENDNVLRIGSLVECHTVPMKLHRAFSVFIFDAQGRLLLQQRAKSKYTFPLSWTNSICSHPRDLSKTMEEWIEIRIKDEFDGWEIPNIKSRLKPFGKLLYEAKSDNKYGEKELDTLFFIQVDEAEKEGIRLNRDEIEAVLWLNDEELAQFIADERNLITPWFRAIYNVHKPLFSNLSSINFEHSNLPLHVAGDVSFTRASAQYDHLLQLPFSYLCSNPGKNIRAMLCDAYREIDSSISASHSAKIAKLVETIHAASLLHDDIEDGSSSRRGAACAHLIYGVARTINTGCFNYLKAVRSIDTEFKDLDMGQRYKLAQLCLEMLMTLHRAQGADISWSEYNDIPSRDAYLEMIDGKTGALFYFCAKASSICGSEGEGENISELFREFGQFFQIRDDYANICDPIYWEAKGFYEDADEGKKSYPVVLFFEKPSVSAMDKDHVKELLSSDHKITLEEKIDIYNLLLTSGVLEETKQICIEMYERIQKNLGSNSPIIGQILAKLAITDVLSLSDVKKLVESKA